MAPDVAQSLIERGAFVDIWAAVGLNDIERTPELLVQDPSLITAPGGDGKHSILSRLLSTEPYLPALA